MLEYFPALIAALIWSYSILIYKDLSIEKNVISVNIWRLTASSIFLIFIYLVFSRELSLGLLYAFLSGALALGLGDSLYFYGSVYAGASVATPITYTYIILIQLTSTLYGEPLTFNRTIASLIAFIGIVLLARKSRITADKKLRNKGIFYSILCMLFWTVGQTMLKPAVLYSDTISINLFRSLSGLLTLFLISKLIGIKLSVFERYNQFKISLFGILDIGIGTLLYITSISTIGLGITVILTSIMPLFTQVFAFFSGREKVTYIEIISAIFIVIAIILCIH